MRFWEAVTSCLANYATFSGRAGRHEFWWFLGFVAIAAGMPALLAPGLPALGAMAPVVALCLLVPLAAVTVRRLHDIGLPGTVGLVVLVPVLGAAALAMILARRGEYGDNRFGDDPRYTFFGFAG